MRGLALVMATLGFLTTAACRRIVPLSNGQPTGKTVVLSNGLKIQEVTPGIDGAVATKGKIVAIHYTGWLDDGKTVVDSTRDRDPLQFQLGEGTVLKGWDLGVEGMKLGGKRRLTVPPALAFGKRTLGVIKPDSTLVFDVELVKVQ